MCYAAEILSTTNMASLVFGPSELVLISTKYMKIYDTSNGNEQVIENEYKTQPTDVEPEKNGTKPNDEGSDNILSVCLSPSGKLCAVADDRKQLSLWKTGSPWTLISTRTISRRVTSMTFTQCEGRVLAADKSGDVYSYSIAQPDAQGQLLLGHVSMLLDVKLCCSDQYVLTCDRDEKIRVSHFPNAYNVLAYCLGHTEFVSRLCYIKEDELVISASGDETIRLWKYQNGEELDCVRCSDHLPLEPTPTSTETPPSDQEQDENEKEAVPEAKTKSPDFKCLSYCSQHRMLVVGFECSPHILTYRLTKQNPPQLSHQRLITLAAPLWDCGFDSSDRLWLLQQLNDDTLRLYDWTPEDGQQQLRRVEPTDDTTDAAIMSSVNNNWTFFQELPTKASVFAVLHKARIDNMPEYIEKKKKRMAQKKQAKTAAPTADEESGDKMETTKAIEASDSDNTPKKIKTDN